MKKAPKATSNLSTYNKARRILKLEVLDDIGLFEDSDIDTITEDTVIDSIERKEIRNIINTTINKSSNNIRKAMQLRYIERKSLHQIADVTPFTAERVRQIASKYGYKLKLALMNKGYDLHSLHS